MEATCFILLEQSNLEQLLRSNHVEQKQTLKNFSRFLSAYFANLPLICSRTNRSLPSLFQLADNYVIRDSDFYVVDRRRLSINLPVTYTPSLAVQLLFKCNLFLEAVFFVEQFNDLRSALIARHLVDLKCGLHLFDDFCQQTFIHNFFEQLPRLVEDCAAGSVGYYLIKFVDVLVQLSVTFKYELLEQFSKQLICNIELLSSGFDERIPEIVALPRPLVYALPSELLFDQELSKELRLWNELHYSIKIFTFLLQRTNRLNTVLQQTTAWLCRLNADFQTEIPSLIELESTPIDLGILEQFQKVLLVVLRANYRDALCSAVRFQDPESLIDELTQNYINLFPTQEINSRSTLQRYLPPLTDDTLEKWKSFSFMQTQQHSLAREHNFSVLEQNDKIHVNDYNFKRLQFIACSMPSFSLNDPALIQICLQLQPADFCIRTEESLIDSSNNVSSTHRQIDEQHSLKQQIRATIRRLGRQTLTQRAEKLHFLPRLLDDFNDHLSAKEVQSDGQFLATVRGLTAKRPSNITRSLSEKNLAPTKPLKIKVEDKTKHEVKEAVNRNYLPILPTNKKRYRKKRPKSQPNSIQYPRSLTQQQEEVVEQFPAETDTRRLAEFEIGSENEECEEVVNEDVEQNNNLEPNPTIDLSPPLDALITPGSIERLDFSQLSDRDDKPKMPKGWSEISVLERSPTSTKRVKIKTPKAPNVYPDWLKLLPLEDKATSSRLLDLNSQRSKKVPKTTPTLQLLNPPNAKVYDSGYLDSEREVQKTERMPALSFDMSLDEIRQLIEQCNE
ncbi:hypothetical protein M3Y97_00744300 [Aphelenchoides bicaudatus]|nr:hypothetical protein M3Y97_00744300 [Aphelenchoides bicaudatus]